MSTPTEMTRWTLTGAPASGIDSLTRDIAPVPEPGPGEVRIRVHAASLNFRDVLVCNGMYPVPTAPGLVPLSDGAGVVDAVGPGVGSWSVGDRVVSVYFKGWADGAPGPAVGLGLGSGAEHGMLAEYVVQRADRIVAAPSGLSLTEAATLPCAALTTIGTELSYETIFKIIESLLEEVKAAQGSAHPGHWRRSTRSSTPTR
jgi:NADPH:quinone reductase-like Zn-dependent oxidoreductase